MVLFTGAMISDGSDLRESVILRKESLDFLRARVGREPGLRRKQDVLARADLQQCHSAGWSGSASVEHIEKR